MPFRLLRVAPRTTRCAVAVRRSAGASIFRSPRRNAPVSEAASRSICAGDARPAVHAGARPEVDHVVGRADHLLVVLDDDDRVAEVAQAEERFDQAVGVAGMQAD
jgi:hypothetical protein